MAAYCGYSKALSVFMSRAQRECAEPLSGNSFYGYHVSRLAISIYFIFQGI